MINKQKNFKETKVGPTNKTNPEKIPIKPSTPNAKVNDTARGANIKSIKEISKPDGGRSIETSKVTVAGSSSPKPGVQKKMFKTLESEVSPNQSGDTIDNVLTIRKLDNDEELLLPSDIDKCIVHKQPLSPLPAIHTEAKTYNKDETCSKIDTDYVHGGENIVVKLKTRPSDDLYLDQSHNDKVQSDALDQQFANEDGKKVTDTQKPTAELSGDTSLSVLGDPGVVGKPVYLYGSETHKTNITAFSEVLKDAGYDNAVLFRDLDLSGSSQVVIVCLNGAVLEDFLRKVIIVIFMLWFFLVRGNLLQ